MTIAERDLDMPSLITKCEQTITAINTHFNNQQCPAIKDLYLPDQGKRQKNFLQLLSINCNNKLRKKNVAINKVKGLYVFGESDKKGTITPVYIGISRSVFRRLYQHVWRGNHNQASLAYLHVKDNELHTGGRDLVESTKLHKMQKEIRNYKVLVIPETDDYDLYFMEVYIAGKLKTKWNSFKTH